MSYYQTIYNRLRSAGLTEAGALGMLGNWDCESNCEPFRLQGDFSSFRTNSKAYVSGVTNGSISRDSFARDSKGFGLAQWTYYSRKYALYDFWKASGRTLDDPVMQTDFALKELREDYVNVLNTLKAINDLYTCTKIVCTQFERPAINNIDARFQSAQRIKNEIELSGSTTEEPAAETPSGWELIPATEYWPPRMICKGMNGPDIEVLQAVLKARGWITTNPDGIFGSYLETKVKEFQTAYQLDVDGIVGNQTWAVLLSNEGNNT